MKGNRIHLTENAFQRRNTVKTDVRKSGFVACEKRSQRPDCTSLIIVFRICSLGNIIAKLDIHEKTLTSVPMHGFSLNFAFNNSTYTSYENIFIEFISFLYNNTCTYDTISSHTAHFEIQKKGFRRKSIVFCKSVSQLFNISGTINV